MRRAFTNDEVGNIKTKNSTLKEEKPQTHIEIRREN